MHLTLQQLRLFEAVARNGSYTRAAEELHLTQPAVSIQVKRLEEQVGLPVFDQVGKRIFLTAAGKELYETAVEILGRINHFKDAVADLQGRVKGPLQLAVVTTAKYFMPRLLGAYLQEYPEVEPKLVFTNRATVVKRLNENVDDFVVMGRVPKGLALEAHPFLENVLVVAAAPDHPLAKETKPIPVERLVNERFLEREVGSGTRKVFDDLLEQHGLSIEPYMELGSTEAIKQGVMAGLGLSVLSLHSLNLERASGRLVVLNVEGFPIHRRWYAVHLKGKKLSLVSRSFLDFLLTRGEDVLSQAGVLGTSKDI